MQNQSINLMQVSMHFYVSPPSCTCIKTCNSMCMLDTRSQLFITNAEKCISERANFYNLIKILIRLQISIKMYKDKKKPISIAILQFHVT